MARLIDEVTLDFLKEKLQYGEQVDKMIANLETKAKEITSGVASLDELDGDAEKQGSLRIFKKCLMLSVLSEVKKFNAEFMGSGIFTLPAYYAQIVNHYSDAHPDDNAFITPLCILCQVARKTFGEAHHMDVQHVACKPFMSKNVVCSKKGLEKSGITEEKAKELLANTMCMYMAKEQ